MRNLLLIARREFLERVRTKSFLLSTIIIPAMMLGGLFFMGRDSRTAAHIAIASQDTTLALDTQAQLDADSDLEVDVRAYSAAAQQNLTAAVASRKLDGFFLIDTAGNVLTFGSAAKHDDGTLRQLTGALHTVVVRQQLPAQQPLLHAAVRQVHIAGTSGARADKNPDSPLLAAYALFFLMYFVVMMHGINVARSVVEEKTSRVFEVMLATVEPRDMMGGKLLGVGAVGLAQVAFWVLCAAAILYTPVLSQMGAGQYQLALSPVQLLAFIGFFVLGYLLYSALAAALGAIVSSEQELGQLNMLIAMPMAVNLFVLYPVTNAPNSLFATVLSFIPTCTPLLMFVRMSIAPVPAWQIALSVVTLALSVGLMVSLSARIYRVGILMYGKRPSLREVLRWMRYS